MSLDVVDLRSFYVHPLGKVARRFVGVGIRRLWHGSRGLRVLGIGYSTPYLGLFREDSERCLAFMPATQGVVKWPTLRPTLAALVDETELPLPDAAVDRILFVHALEMTHDAPALLREVWRVLAPGGRLLAVVPNRRGLWARMDTTPFGHGRPYSRAQITQLLRETWFTPTGMGRSALCAADRAALVPAFGGGVGAHRCDGVGAVCRGPPRGGDEAGLSHHPGAPQKAGAEPRAGARTGARALTGRGRPKFSGPLKLFPAEALGRQAMRRVRSRRFGSSGRAAVASRVRSTACAHSPRGASSPSPIPGAPPCTSRGPR